MKRDGVCKVRERSADELGAARGSDRSMAATSVDTIGDMVKEALFSLTDRLQASKVNWCHPGGRIEVCSPQSLGN